MTAQVPWLTIVTVVRDDTQGFLQTGYSLLACEMDDVEWVVVDSSTGLESGRVRQFLEQIKIHSRYRWVEPLGIYSAMNDGLNIAIGRFIYFLNAGDRLHSPEQFSTVMSELKQHPTPQWLVAQVNFHSSRKHDSETPDLDYFRERQAFFARGKFPPHQGTIVQSDLLRSLHGFDLRYRVCADYHLMLKVSQRSNPYISNAVLADFAPDGASTALWRTSIREFHLARRSIYTFTPRSSAIEYLRTATHFLKLGSYQLWRRQRSRFHPRGSRGPGAEA